MTFTIIICSFITLITLMFSYKPNIINFYINDYSKRFHNIGDKVIYKENIFTIKEIIVNVSDNKAFYKISDESSQYITKHENLILYKRNLKILFNNIIKICIVTSLISILTNSIVFILYFLGFFIFFNFLIPLNNKISYYDIGDEIIYEYKNKQYQGLVEDIKIIIRLTLDDYNIIRHDKQVKLKVNNHLILEDEVDFKY